jgi:type IV secretion system protein TrbJ
MKCPTFSFKNHRKASIVAALMIGAVTPALAQFGFSIVQDPAEIAQTINNLKQAIQIALTTKQTLATVQANLKNFSFKSLWQTGKAQIMAESVNNSYGETAGWSTALNTNSPAAATTAWNMANVQVNSGAYLSGQTPGNSPELASLAMVEAFDSSSPACMNAVGQYRALQTTNAAAETALQTGQLDTTTATNSEVEQLNLLNASDVQQMHETQSQGQLQACLAEQTTIANMMQRNAAAVSINDAVFAQQQQAANNVMPTNESHTWQTYIP